MEYASTVWSPHTATDITKLEAVQRRSARWATRDYQRNSSVTPLYTEPCLISSTEVKTYSKKEKSDSSLEVIIHPTKLQALTSQENHHTLERFILFSRRRLTLSLFGHINRYTIIAVPFFSTADSLRDYLECSVVNLIV